MVSVSTIAGLIDDGKADGFAYKARKLALEGLHYQEVWDYRADLGTRVHKHLTALEEIEALDDELPYLDAVESWCRDFQPVSLYQERVVLSDLGYGGRFDDVSLLGDVSRLNDKTLTGDELWGIDAKTGKEYERQIEIQHAGYWRADWLAEYDEAGRLTELLPMPKVHRWAGLYLHENGTYDFIPYPKRRRGQRTTPIEVLQDNAFEAFKHLLAVYFWLHPTRGLK